MKEEALKMKEPGGARPQLVHLEHAIQAELGALRAGVEPLLSEVRAAVAALYPEAGGTRLAPKEHEARHEKLLESLDGLEDVLEALQLAARAGRPVVGTTRGGG
ncbi:MAG TPA: hypothetical protein VE153_39000 [Myxococcus sp.]|jgi:hypothetical protein|nr:hypothetical protein [Myxococcus sp.]